MLNHLTESNHNNTATILRNQKEGQAKTAVVEQQQVICDFFTTGSLKRERIFSQRFCSVAKLKHRADFVHLAL
jgi:hypothetical protein